MTEAPSLLVRALRRPQSLHFASTADWERLIAQARSANLAGYLERLLREHGLAARVPAGARRHLDSARVVAERHAAAVRWEMRRIGAALAGLDVPVVALKGAAYTLAELPAARGRVFYDIDIMVPKARLGDVERRLRRHGWWHGHLDPYDQRYYREWMHELPPLEHLRRKATLDVHHRILPETARLQPDPERMLAAARPLPGWPGVYTLSPAHMVLHSATHLFHDGELEHGLRDLVDLDGLLRHFGASEPGFWAELVREADALDLTRPLFYGLRYAHAVLGTPIPEAAARASRAGAPRYLGPVMDVLLSRALAPDHPSCRDALTGAARWLLYVRSHYLRMPARLLLPHLTRKALRRRFERPGAGDARGLRARA